MSSKSSDEKQKRAELRRIQTIHNGTTYVLAIPRAYVDVLQIAKGDYVKRWVSENLLLVQKQEV
jgi:hypothetical protein